MAFQPKSYRKFMVASASAALVGSAVAPAVSAATAAEDFSDVTEETRHYNDINALYEMEVVSGYPDGTFGPDNNLKRSEAAEMIFTARGLSVDTENELTLTGVPDRISDVVAELEAEGIFEGNAEGEFNANAELNRAEMAKVVIEAFDLMPEDGVEESPFEDRGDTSLNTYVDAVYALDIADGYDETTFGVHDSILRKDFSKMLHNAYKLWEEQNAAEVQTVADVDGTVKDVLGINWVVDIPAANLDATSESTVELKVGEETIELAYNADNDSFRNAEIPTSFEEEELVNAEVVVDGGVEAPAEATDLGAVSDIEGSKAKDVLGINRVVDLPLASLEGASADSTVWIEVNGEEIELSFDADNESFRNAEISTDYSVADLNEATVFVQ